MAEELELKYAIDDAAAVEAWLDSYLPPAADDGWRTIRITDRYFDTADRKLSAAGYGARLRRIGRQTTLTLKTDVAAAGGLHRRIELEGPAKQSLDPARWPQSEARDRLVELAFRDRLVELFVVQQRRRERVLTAGGARIAASIDTGTVFAAGAAAGDITQFELEYHGGRRAGLNRIAKAVEGSGVARPEPRSKLAQALGMVADANRFGPDDLLAEAGRRVLRRHFLRMLDREIGAAEGDSLALKQMRVATRRLRATWRAFDDAFKKSVSHFALDTRRVGRALGAVRDLDVFTGTLADDERLASFADQLRERRADSFAALLRLLSGKRYARFVEEMLVFTSSVGAGVARGAATVTVRDRAPAAIAEATAMVRAAGTLAIGGDDAVAWHSLRIEARRLRYTIEGFGDGLDSKAAKELIARVTRIQDHLGAMNDAAVAIEEASLWLADNGADVGSPVHAALGDLIAKRESEIVRLRRGFGSAWRGVSGLSFDRLMADAVKPLK